MFEFLLRKWGEGKVTEADIDHAVSQGWITIDEGMIIKSGGDQFGNN